MKIYTVRLNPGQDLRFGIEKFVHDNSIQAGFIITCVGALKEANLRMPGGTPVKKEYTSLNGPLEITSLAGMVSTNGCHIHISVSDQEGRAFGGHVTENCEVSRTAEIVIGEDESVTYSRELDDQTGFPELVIKPRRKQ